MLQKELAEMPQDPVSVCVMCACVSVSMYVCEESELLASDMLHDKACVCVFGGERRGERPRYSNVSQDSMSG